MIPSNQLSTLIAVAAALWAFFLLLSGITTSQEFLAPFSSVTGALGILLFAFDKWLWRLRFLHSWFVEVPDLRGVWRTEIDSSRKDDAEGKRPVTIEGYMVIRQTYSTISMRFITRESSSKLLAARILREPDGLYVIYGVYINEPKHSLRVHSQIHYGSFKLSVVDDPPNKLIGHYWTDRKTQDELTLTERKNCFPDDFESAAGLYKAT